MLLGEVICDGVGRIAKRSFQERQIMTGSGSFMERPCLVRCSDILGTVVHVRHRSNNRRLHRQQRDEGKGVKNRLGL